MFCFWEEVFYGTLALFFNSAFSANWVIEHRIQGSSVTTVTRLWGGRLELDSWQGQGFSSAMMCSQLWGLHSLLSNGYQGLFSQG
jgi:hypothetical protein